MRVGLPRYLLNTRLTMTRTRTCIRRCRPTRWPAAKGAATASRHTRSCSQEEHDSVMSRGATCHDERSPRVAAHEVRPAARSMTASSSKVLQLRRRQLVKATHCPHLAPHTLLCQKMDGSVTPLQLPVPVLLSRIATRPGLNRASGPGLLDPPHSAHMHARLQSIRLLPQERQQRPEVGRLHVAAGVARGRAWAGKTAASSMLTKGVLSWCMTSAMPRAALAGQCNHHSAAAAAGASISLPAPTCHDPAALGVQQHCVLQLAAWVWMQGKSARRAEASAVSAHGHVLPQALAPPDITDHGQPTHFILYRTKNSC